MIARLATLFLDQLQLALEPPPRSGEALLDRLRALGLRGIDRCVLTSNHSVMVSFRDHELRVHHAYLDAPPAVLRAIVVFVGGRTRQARRDAQRTILSFPVPVPPRPVRRRPERARPEDATLIAELRQWHQRYNEAHFGGVLSEIRLRLSGRMRSKLGQYAAPLSEDDAPEITISRRHLRRHGWEEVLHTLLHEMVHQWQCECGLPIDHGHGFREKARDIGIVPHARRTVQARSRAGRVLSVPDSQRAAARSE